VGSSLGVLLLLPLAPAAPVVLKLRVQRKVVVDAHRAPAISTLTAALEVHLHSLPMA
jgi:hypothetical protein